VARSVGTALAFLSGALWLAACSYSAAFAFSNETEENGTLFLTLRQQNGQCPELPVLSVAPSSQLRPGWFREPSPHWSPLSPSSFTYSNVDCSIIAPLGRSQAISIAWIPDILIERADWIADFPVERLTFRSESYSLDLDRAALLGRFEHRAELLFVASVQPPDA
jgi:hypothetical protein